MHVVHQASWSSFNYQLGWKDRNLQFAMLSSDIGLTRHRTSLGQIAAEIHLRPLGVGNQPHGDVGG